MKIAILLLVHKDKAQVERLLSRLRHPQFDIFMHVDLKCPFSPAELNAPGVVFTEQRYDIGLFEFSMVEAEMELLRTAQSRGAYDYYMLMSGQCYPLLSMDQIYARLCTSHPRPLIEIVAPTRENYVRVNFAHVYILKRFKLRTYAFLKKHFSYRGYRILRYLPGGTVLLVSRLKELFVRSPQVRLARMQLPTYCGSQWWILPDDVVRRAMAFYEDKAFCAAVSDSFSCDETFFQTAVMAQPEQNRIELDADGNYMHRQWFFIFDDGHPITLTRAHYDELRSSGMLMARKFDPQADNGILDLLDQDSAKQ